jgi:hypothetical protein
MNMRSQRKVKVQIVGGVPSRVIGINPDATEGAIIGVNVYNEDGSLFVPETAAPAGGTIQVRDENVVKGLFAILDFVGSAIQVTVLDGRAIVTLDIDIADVNGLAAALAALAAATVPIIHTTTGPVYNATETAGDVTIFCDASAAPITVNLPTAVGNTAIFTVKKTDATANGVTIDPSGAETIDDGATAVMVVENVSLSLKSDNANWNIR